MDAIASSGSNGLITFPEALTFFHIKEIAAFAIAQKLPSIYGWRVFAQNGGLITYGPNLRDAYARLATYVVKILKGASPSSLPVEEPSRIETIVNLRTAKQIGLPISPTLLSSDVRVTSALPPIATLERTCRDVCYVPQSDITAAIRSQRQQ